MSDSGFPSYFSFNEKCKLTINCDEVFNKKCKASVDNTCI